jgi:outer membrane protein
VAVIVVTLYSNAPHICYYFQRPLAASALGRLMFRFIKPTLVCVALLPIVGQTQSSPQPALLGLQEAIDLALANNLNVVNVQLEIDATEGQVAALRARRFPQLTVTGVVSENLEEQEYTFDEGVWGDYPVIGPVPSQDTTIESASGTTGIVSANATQPISQLYSLGLSIEQSEVQEGLAREQKRLTEQDLARVVKQNYFEIVQTQSDLMVTQESIVFYESLQELVANYVAEEVSLEYELLDVEARLARRKLDAASQDNRLINQNEHMNNLLARDLNTRFTVQELPEQIVVTNSEADAIADALNQRPNILKSKLEVENAQLNYDITKAGYIPDLDIRLRYTRLFNYELIPDTEAYIGLQAKWEFFDWGRKRNELSSQNSLIRAAANEMKEVENRVIIEVRNSLRTISLAEDSVVVARLTQDAARNKLQVLSNQYEQQSALLQDVLDAETELDRANNDYNRAVLSVWKARAELDRAMGEI